MAPQGAPSLVRRKWGEDLRHARLRAGLTQEGLAELAGTHQPSISKVEAGEYPGIGVDLMLRLAVALGVDPETIFGWPYGIRTIAEHEQGAA